MRTRIELSNQRFLIAGHSRAGRKARTWLVYLPESNADFHPGSRGELVGLVGRSQAARLNYLVINKPGLSASRKDQDVFERSFRRGLRISDALKTAGQIIPSGDKIFIVGYSEGAYLAPELALKLGDRVCGLVMIGGGTRGWLSEELSHSFGREKAALRRQISRIESRPDSVEKWNGFSYATWNSYAADTTLISLKKLPTTLPMLSILGCKDNVIDLKATLEDLLVLERSKSLSVETYSACGHSFTGHWAAVRKSLSAFLDRV